MICFQDHIIAIGTIAVGTKYITGCRDPSLLFPSQMSGALREESGCVMGMVGVVSLEGVEKEVVGDCKGWSV